MKKSRSSKSPAVRPAVVRPEPLAQVIGAKLPPVYPDIPMNHHWHVARLG